MKRVLAFMVLLGLSFTAFAQTAKTPALHRNTAIKAGIKAEAYDKVAKYYEKHFSELSNKKYLSFVDFGYPSTQERLFVVNLTTGKVSKFLVTHGKNSGENMATSFSNMAESNKSSLGLYVIETEYIGQHGKTLRLDGLENGKLHNGKILPDSEIDGIRNGKNSNAKDRAIVMHSASYANRSSIAGNGGKRLGRSQGCPAVSPADWAILRPVLKGGSLLLIYKKK
jgi:L,D-transpeptidase catalytic domain